MKKVLFVLLILAFVFVSVAFAARQTEREVIWSQSFADCAQLTIDQDAQTVTCYGFLPVVTTTSTPSATPTAPVPPTATNTLPPTVTNTPPPTHTPVPTATDEPGTDPGDHIFISDTEIANAPASGPEWDLVQTWAAMSASSPNLSDQDDQTGAVVLAKALVYAKTGDDNMRLEAASAILNAMETENGGRTLALGRNLVSYVIAADLVGLDNSEFNSWLDGVRYESLEGRAGIDNIQDSALYDAANWGANARASAIAAAMYLNDTAALAALAENFHDWMGRYNPDIHFNDSDLSWHADPEHPVGINPANTFIDGHPVSGVLPDDQRRGGSFRWPPPCENYVWGNLQGSVGAAWLLERAGYFNVWDWEDQALLRAMEWLHNEASCPATGDDTGVPHAINSVYNTDFPPLDEARPGKNGMGLLFYWLG